MNSINENNSKNLKLLSDYKNEDVLFRFSQLYDMPEDDIKELFEETKKWLYAVSINSQLYKNGEVDFRIGVNDDLLMLDEMWHNFILFTRDYKIFCDKYFGRFINHQPRTFKEYRKEIEKQNVNFELVQEERKASLKKQYSFIYDLLGEKTLIKWHKEWPIKYCLDNIKSLRK